MTTQTKGSSPAKATGDDIHNPLFARLYHYVFARGEGKRMRRCRDRMVEGLTGRELQTNAQSVHAFRTLRAIQGEILEQV